MGNCMIDLSDLPRRRSTCGTGRGAVLYARPPRSARVWWACSGRSPSLETRAGDVGWVPPLAEGRSERYTAVRYPGARTVQGPPQGPQNEYQYFASPAVGPRTARAPRGGNPVV